MTLVTRKWLPHMDCTIHRVAGIATEAAGAERIAGASVQNNLHKEMACRFANAAEQQQQQQQQQRRRRQQQREQQRWQQRAAAEAATALVSGQCGSRQPPVASCAAAAALAQQFPHI